MISLNLQAIEQAFASRTLNTLIEGMALAGFSWLILRLLGRVNAVTRFAVWFSTLILVVLMPLLLRGGSAAVFNHRGVQLTSVWADGLFLVWFLFAFLLFARLAVLLWDLRQMRKECIEVSDRPDLWDTVSSKSTRRNIKILVSSQVRVPTAIGFFHPAVILPAWSLQELSPDELQAVVLHELAHLRRWDDWTNLAQKILKAIFFFHPAVWFIENRLSLERELACDDSVLRETANAQGYAASLVSIAERTLSQKEFRRTLALAQGALGRMRQMSERMTQILDPARSSRKQSWRIAAGAITSVLFVAVAAGHFAPELVSFGVNETAAVRVPPPSIAIPQNHVIRASLKSSAGETTKIISARLKTRHHRFSKPGVIMARAQQDQIGAQLLFFVQPSQLSQPAARPWTLYVVNVRYTSTGQQQVEEIIMSSI